MGSPRTVFTLQSLMMLTECNDSKKLTKSLHYYTKGGKILNPRKGVYAKLKYDEQEMACSLFRPSYISLEYVLGRAGVVFQWDDTVTRIVLIACSDFVKRYRCNSFLKLDLIDLSFSSDLYEHVIGKSINNRCAYAVQTA